MAYQILFVLDSRFLTDRYGTCAPLLLNLLAAHNCLVVDVRKIENMRLSLCEQQKIAHEFSHRRPFLNIILIQSFTKK